MLRLREVTKVYHVNGVPHLVTDRISADLPSGIAIGLLGHNGAGKSTLLRMIAGTVKPTSGRIETGGTISWPVGHAGSFHGELTGAQNVRFIARIYGVDSDGLVDYVEDFADLGKHFHLPFRSYSAGMRARLAFGVSMGIRFDTYLIDEVTSVGDAAFRSRSERVLNDRLGSSGAIVVSHGLDLIRRLCGAAAVLHQGRLHWFDEVEEAIALHLANMKARAN